MRRYARREADSNRIAPSNLGPPQGFFLHWTQNVFTQSYDNQIPFRSGSITRATLSAELLRYSQFWVPRKSCAYTGPQTFSYKLMITRSRLDILLFGFVAWKVSLPARAHQAFGVNKFTLARWALVRASERETVGLPFGSPSCMFRFSLHGLFPAGAGTDLRTLASHIDGFYLICPQAHSDPYLKNFRHVSNLNATKASKLSFLKA